MLSRVSHPRKAFLYNVSIKLASKEQHSSSLRLSIKLADYSSNMKTSSLLLVTLTSLAYVSLASPLAKSRATALGAVS
jgi:hypothetical protein